MAVTEIVGQVRCVAVDLVRAAELLAEPQADRAPDEALAESRRRCSFSGTA